MDIAAAAADAPPVLRPAITGPGAWKRLRRLAAAGRRCSRPPTARRSSPPYAKPVPPGQLTTSAHAAQGKRHQFETDLGAAVVRHTRNRRSKKINVSCAVR